MLKSYIKRNRIWMACALLLMLFAVFYMFLVQVFAWDILYFLGLESFLFVMVGACGYGAYRGKVRRLKEHADRLKNEGITLPEQGDAMEQIYREMIEELNTECKLSEAAYAKRQSEMREYYAMWVHQIKTPIAAMQLLLQVQQNDAGSETMQLQAELEKELFDIEQYVNMALQYQRVNAPGNDYLLERISLDTLVREVIRKYAKLMVRKHIPLSYEGTDLMVVTDAKWVSFAIGQILSNAIKYSHENDRIVIGTVQEGDWNFLKITDHGIGIRREDISLVFQKGYTGYNGHMDKKSTGIGLYLSKLVLNKLGHSIRLESEYGEGTTVWIGFHLTEM